MSETDDGRRAPFPRDTPKNSRKNPQKIPFQTVLDLQTEAYEIKDLSYALGSVIAVLVETPGISPHPAVSAADTLIEKLQSAQADHLTSLEALEKARVG